MGRLLGLPCVSLVTVSVPVHPTKWEETARNGWEWRWAGPARGGVGTHLRGSLALSHLLDMQCRGGQLWAGPGFPPRVRGLGGPGCLPVATHRPGALEGKGPPLQSPAPFLPYTGAAPELIYPLLLRRSGLTEALLAPAPSLSILALVTVL